MPQRTCCWNYLRVRGEYLFHVSETHSAGELPPRARRIQPPLARASIASGTTSACAENTDADVLGDSRDGNYLRVRGEYHGFRASPLKNTELPPRARRILTSARCFNASTGTTSACAENTVHECCPIPCIRNYLRVRGEYSRTPAIVVPDSELPPRARRIRTRVRTQHRAMGTTSACAENT